VRGKERGHHVANRPTFLEFGGDVLFMRGRRCEAPQIKRSRVWAGSMMRRARGAGGRAFSGGSVFGDHKGGFDGGSSFSEVSFLTFSSGPFLPLSSSSDVS